MEQELLAKAPDNDDFERPNTGLVQAVCAFVEDVGTHKSSYQGKERIRHRIVICFELAQQMTKGEYAGKPFMVSNFYTLSLSRKATLAHDLESWFAKELSEEQRKNGINLKKLIGKACMLNLVERKKAAGGEYIAISGILPTMAGAKPMAVFNANPPSWIAEVRADSLEAKEGHRRADGAL